MRTRCPRCTYQHNVDAPDMVRQVLKEKPHENSVFVQLPTRELERLTVIHPDHAEKVIAIYNSVTNPLWQKGEMFESENVLLNATNDDSGPAKPTVE